MRTETSVIDAVADSNRARTPLISASVAWSGRFASIRTARRKRSPVDQPIPFTHDGLLWLHFNLADARALQWLTPANLAGSAAGACAAAVEGQFPAASHRR